MEFKSNRIRWIWDDSTTAVSPTDSMHTAPEPSTNDMDIKPMAYGWICPRCGRVNAPWVTSCFCSVGKRWEITC